MCVPQPAPVRFPSGSPAFARDWTRRLPAGVPKGVGGPTALANEAPAGKPAFPSFALVFRCWQRLRTHTARAASGCQSCARSTAGIRIRPRGTAPPLRRAAESCRCPCRTRSPRRPKTRRRSDAAGTAVHESQASPRIGPAPRHSTGEPSTGGLLLAVSRRRKVSCPAHARHVPSAGAVCACAAAGSARQTAISRTFTAM